MGYAAAKPAGGEPQGSDETAVEKAAPTAVEKRGARRKEATEATEEAAKAVESLATIGPSSMMPFNPKDFTDMWKLAKLLSESGVVAQSLEGDGGGVFALMARGAQMDIHWSVAITEGYVVNRKIGWSAALMDGLIETSPSFEYFEVAEATAKKVAVEAKRPRWDTARKYEVTIEEAQAAGYLNPQGHYSKVWQTRPKLMLIAMARREAARMWDPARFAGLYTYDELMAQGLRVDAKATLSATAALESFGAAPAALPAVVEIVDRADAEGAEGVNAPPGRLAASLVKDEPVHLGAAQLKTIRTNLASAPVIQESALRNELGASLEELSGPPGSKVAELYTLVLGVLKKMKREAASTA